MRLRNVAPIQREQWVLPLLIGIIVAALELLRSAGHRVPAGGAVVLLLTLYTAYRAGVVPAIISASCLGVFMLRAADIGWTVPPLAMLFAVFGSTLLVGWLATRQRLALEDALRAREQAQRSETRYRDLVEGLESVVWEADADTFRVRFVSKRAEILFGYAVSEWIGSAQIWRRLIHPDDYDRTMDACRAAIQQGRDHDLEYRVITRSGETLHVRDIVHMDSTVIPPLLRGILFDVSREHHAIDALQDTERKLRAFINNAPDALIVHDATGRIVEVNRRACDSLGYTRDEMLRMRLTDLDLKAGDATLQPDSGELTRGPRVSEGLFRRSNGMTVPVEIATSMWETRPLLFISLARDITRKTQLEEQLRHAQRMEAVGRLAGGIAHDFNNLLTAIRGHADLLAADLDGDAHSDLDEIGKAADRAASLTRQLLAFSRQQMLQMEVFDLNDVVAEMQRLFGRLIGENITLMTAIDPGIAPIEADRTQIEQVLMNLVLNARDAMPDGGRMSIRTATAILTEVDADRFPFVQPGTYVLLSVTDNGAGMDAATVTRIFDPFFTTKEQGKGSGLGLATVYGIVKQLDGYVWCDSEAGKGTTFRVYLPPADSPIPARADETTPASPSVRQADETILLVEDEPAVRALVRRVLLKQGYRVIDAGNGVEALDLVEGLHNSPIDLLLTDVVMPEMGGRDLADHLAPVRPTMKVLYMSGYAEDAIVVNHILQPGVAFLQKPFAPDTLTAKVRETLES